MSKYIELRVFVKESDEENILETAEAIKNYIYDREEDISPVKDVTYEIVEDGRKDKE